MNESVRIDCGGEICGLKYKGRVVYINLRKMGLKHSGGGKGVN